MKFSRSAALCLSLLAASTQPVVSFVPSRVTAPASWALSSSSTDKDTLGLTDELQKLTDAFANIGDDKLRYKQLLYMASNGLEAMPEELKTDSNKVLGCLSTVHVYATPQQQGDATIIHFQGDSDGLLTKGLVALLVRCVLFIANCWILCCNGNINFAVWVGYDVFLGWPADIYPWRNWLSLTLKNYCSIFRILHSHALLLVYCFLSF